jgi:nucleotide-binding universal stress UspA family protein
MKIRHVLYAADFSDASGPAGAVARDLARESGAVLHVVHVVPPVTDPSVSAERVRTAAVALAEGVATEVAVLTGRAAREIVRYARDKGVDLIVLGTHGRTGVTRAILGSVAEAVVRTAPCLVLTVPAEAVARQPGAPAPAGETLEPHRCVVCAVPTEDLICEPCRARIRGEALGAKLDAERAGRRGTPA